MARNKERAMEQEMAAAGAHMVRHVHTFDVILFIVLTLLALVIVYPFYNTILVSIVPQVDYSSAVSGKLSGSRSCRYFI